MGFILVRNTGKVLIKALIKTINFVPNIYMGREEAMKILNLRSDDLEKIKMQYELNFKKNEGYDYLQQKITNARKILYKENKKQQPKLNSENLK